MAPSFLYDAVRTPFGRFNGALAGARPDDLAAVPLAALVARSPELDPGQIDDVVMGNANGSGEDNRNVGRMAVLLAGLPTSVPANTVNRLCGSSLDAAMIASRAIETGDADIVIAAGVESMTRSPWVLPKPAKGFPAADVTAVSTTLGWRLVNPAMPGEFVISNGAATELLAERFGIDRYRQDAFALRSHQRADAGWREGFYGGHVIPVPGAALERDEGIRADSTIEALAKLKPAFAGGGTITAGNASPLTDGASAVLIGGESAAVAIGREPLARIAGRGVYADEPRWFGYAPVGAAERALKQAGLTWFDIGAVELNEAFAAQSLTCLDAWDIDPELVNQRGGAIAIGHPLGASGGRVLATLTNVLRETGSRYGVAAICIGVGQGLAVVLENLSTDKTAA